MISLASMLQVAVEYSGDAQSAWSGVGDAFDGLVYYVSEHWMLLGAITLAIVVALRFVLKR